MSIRFPLVVLGVLAVLLLALPCVAAAGDRHDRDHDHDEAAASAADATANTTAERALCHVCRVHDGEAEPEPVAATATHDGTTYGFCSLPCRDRFLEDPAGYVPPVFPRPAPAFRAEALDGAPVALADYEGRVLLLDFWATWCPPCIEDLPALTRLHQRHAERGLTVLSLSIDPASVDVAEATRKVRRMVRKRDAEHPIALDVSSQAWAAYHVRAVPTQFLIDRDGRIVAQWSGVVDLDEVEEAIVGLLELDPVD